MRFRFCSVPDPYVLAADPGFFAPDRWGHGVEKTVHEVWTVHATLQTAMDDLKGAIAAQAQAGGGTVVTAVKKKKRNVLDGLLRKLAHYVQANCNDDVQLVVKTGFQAKTASAKSFSRLSPKALFSENVNAG